MEQHTCQWKLKKNTLPLFNRFGGDLFGCKSVTEGNFYMPEEKIAIR